MKITFKDGKNSDLESTFCSILFNCLSSSIFGVSCEFSRSQDLRLKFVVAELTSIGVRELLLGAEVLLSNVEIEPLLILCLEYLCNIFTSYSTILKTISKNT